MGPCGPTGPTTFHDVELSEDKQSLGAETTLTCPLFFTHA
jgi:hypothetical protein